MGHRANHQGKQTVLEQVQEEAERLVEGHSSKTGPEAEL